MPTFRTSRPVSAADVGARNIVLVGLPGSGKSTVGRAVADALGRRFLDFDAEIERREGSTIAEIFAARGESHFRSLERRITEELVGTTNFVAAPGGGWVANPGCMELLRPDSTLVYLEIEPARALARMAGSAASRPLLRHPNPLGELTALLAARQPSYVLAHHTVRVDFMRENDVVAHIVALAG